MLPTHTHTHTHTHTYHPPTHTIKHSTTPKHTSANENTTDTRTEGRLNTHDKTRQNTIASRDTQWTTTNNKQFAEGGRGIVRKAGLGEGQVTHFLMEGRRRLEACLQVSTHCRRTFRIRSLSSGPSLLVPTQMSRSRNSATCELISTTNCRNGKERE